VAQAIRPSSRVKGSKCPEVVQRLQGKSTGQGIAGYGTEAYYDGYASLSVLKGDYYLRIAVQSRERCAVLVRRRTACCCHPAEVVIRAAKIKTV